MISVLFLWILIVLHTKLSMPFTKYSISNQMIHMKTRTIQFHLLNMIHTIRRFSILPSMSDWYNPVSTVKHEYSRRLIGYDRVLMTFQRVDRNRRLYTTSHDIIPSLSDNTVIENKDLVSVRYEDKAESDPSDTLLTQYRNSVEITYKEQIQSLKSIKASKKIFQLMIDSSNQKNLTPYMALLTTRTLQRLDRQDLSIAAIKIWKTLYINSEFTCITNQNSTATFVHECCKLGLMEIAEDIYNISSNKIRLSLYCDIIKGYTANKAFDKVYSYLKLVLSHVTSVPNDKENQQGNTKTVSSDSNNSIAVNVIGLNTKVAKYILSETLRQSMSLQSIVNILETLLEISSNLPEPLLEDYEFTQLLASHYLKQIEFIKGAVSMTTLPTKSVSNHLSNRKGSHRIIYRPEVAFIGRSNVGKSSLINMICNRKNLAYTSKTPGKTSEFNYFVAFGGNRTKEIDVNLSGSVTSSKDNIVNAMTQRSSQNKPTVKTTDKPSVRKKAMQAEAIASATASGFSKGSAMTLVAASQAGYEHEFYLVDLPGLGFAEATKVQRSSWRRLLGEYAVGRDSLRVLFHLIDSRHGPLEADGECFELLTTMPKNVRYVIVLTKIDKNRGSVVTQRLVQQVQQEIDKRLMGSENNNTNTDKDRKKSKEDNQDNQDTIDSHRKISSRDIPILFTSASSKQGGTYIWLEILKGLLVDHHDAINTDTIDSRNNSEI